MALKIQNENRSLRRLLRQGIQNGIALGFLLTCLEVVWSQPPNFRKDAAVHPSGPKEGPSDSLEVNDCTVFAIETVEIPAKESGVLSDVFVRLNQEIEAGDAVAKFETRTVEIERSLAVLQAQLATSEALDDSEVQFADALVEEAKIGLENYERMRSKGSASEAEIRQKQLAVSQAELKKLTAKQQMEQRKLRSKLAQASVIAADEHLARLNLVAPFKGVVKELFRGKGEWVQAGQPICKITRLNELRVDCYIRLEDHQLASFLDLPVTVIPNRTEAMKAQGASGETFVGRITSIDPEVTSLGTVRMHATIQNQRQADLWLLRPGMTVQMRIPPRVPKGNFVREPNVERKP